MPIFHWSEQAISPQSAVRATVRDSKGDIYITGYFNSFIEFDSVQTQTNGGGEINTFLAKYSPNGNLIRTKICRTYKWAVGRNLFVDSLDNITFVGNFQKWIAFGSDTLKTPYGSGFIFKVNSQGNLLWSTKMGGGNYGDIGSMDGKTGELVFHISTGGTLFNVGNNSYSTGGFPSAVIKLDWSGQLAWYKLLDNSFDLQTINQTRNKTILSGFCDDSLKYDGNTLQISSSKQNLFIVEINTLGQATNSKLIPVTGGITLHSAHRLKNDDLILAGSISQTNSFGTTTVNPKGKVNTLLISLDKNYLFNWTKSEGDSLESSFDAVCSDGSNIYCSGYLNAITPLGEQNCCYMHDGSGNLPQNGVTFLSKHSSSGNFLWKKSLPNVPCCDLKFLGMNAQSSDDIVLGGLTFTKIQYDKLDVDNKIFYGTLFLTRLASPFLDITGEEFTKHSFEIFPSHSTGLFNIASSEKLLEITVRDMLGREYPIAISNQLLDLAHLGRGTYFISARNSKFLMTRKVVLISE